MCGRCFSGAIPGPSTASWMKESCEPGLVSVIIPTHNRAQLIGETLASVLTQTHDRVETIVVDDGSTDRTPEVLREWEARFRKERGWDLRVFRQDHKGPSAARNLGMQESRGEFLQFLDSDDLLLPGKLASQIQWLHAHGDFDAVYGYSRYCEDALLARTVYRVYYDPSDRLDFFLRPAGNLWHGDALLWRRSAVNRLGHWDSLLRRCEDWDYLLRHLAGGGKLGCIRRLHAIVRLHPGSTRSKRWDVRDAWSISRFMEKAFQMLARLADGKYLTPLSEKAWVFAARMVPTGYEEPLAALLGVLREIRARGRLSSFVRLAFGGSDSLSMARSRVVWPAYRIRMQMTKLAAFRPW